MRTSFALQALPFLTYALIVATDGIAAFHRNRLMPRMVPGGGRNPGGGGGGGGGKKGQDYGAPYEGRHGGVYRPGRGAADPQVRNAIAQEPAYSSGWDPVLPHTPAPGESGVFVDHGQKRVELFYGDEMPYHGDGELYHQQAYPGSADRGYGNADGTLKKEERARALKGLPAGYGPGMHRDENRAGSFNWMGNGLSRNSEYGFNPRREDTTNMPVPQGESARQSVMMAKAAALLEVHPGYLKYVIDNRLNTASVRVPPNKGPYLGGNNDGRGHPFHTTNEKPGYQRRVKRDINQISNINSQISDQKTTSTDLQQQYELNLLAYQTVSANATELLFPVIDQLLAKSNLTIIHDMAFSLLQIVGSPQFMVGPFMYGTTDFDWFEDQITRNMTDEQKQNDPNVQLMYAQDGLLIELYEQAWANGTVAANVTGYLSDLEALASHLITNDTSIIPQAATTVVQDQYYEDIDYFYADIIDEISPSASGGSQPYPTMGAPFPTGSGGQWFLGSATGA